MIREIDFKAYQDKNLSKTFKFLDDDGNDYDFTGTTAVILKLYKDPDTPLEITGDLTAMGNALITFIFSSSTHTDALGAWEYRIEDNKPAGITPIGKGNFIVEEYIPFSEAIEAYIRSELPANLTLTTDFQNQRIIYWRRILQLAFEITDANLNIESEWPTLVNALFAKLVVYDALMLAASGAFIQFLGGDYTDATTIGGGGVKSVETGPARVEYFDTASSAKQAFSSSEGDLSMFEALKEGLCGLANHLGIKLQMCKGNDTIIVPEYHQNPDWDYPTLDDFDDLIERQPSQG